MTSATSPPAPSLRSDVFVVALLALVLAAGAFLVQGDIDINLSDEGHLWYVTTRTALGDVPLREVRAYDPGRYYWGAAWFQLLGPGIKSLRIGLTAMQAVGLVLGLLTLRRVVRRWWLLVMTAVILLAWMFPLYKAFESTIILAFIWLAVRLIEAPTPARHFAAGVGIGLAAFVRVDHGLYGVGGFLLVIVFLAVRARRWPPRSLVPWAAGIGVGYAPMLIMLVAVPGFFHGVVENLAYLWRIVLWSGNTNLAKPIPWPWLTYEAMPFLDHLRVLAFGVLFLTIPVLYLLVGLSVLASPDEDSSPRHLALAAGCIGLMYVHYTFSRADVEHLAQSVHAIVIGGTGLLAALGPRLRPAVMALLLPFMLAISGLSVGMMSPVFLRATERSNPFVRARVAGDLLWVHGSTAAFFDTLRRAADGALKPGERILVLPHWPGLYPILDREAPLWETYFVYPEPDERQQQLITEIERRNVTLVLLADILLDGRADLHFSRTHPLVYGHLLARFETMPVSSFPSWIHLLRRRP